MAAGILIGVVLFGCVFGLLGALRGDFGVAAWYAAFGAVFGIAVGVYWHRQDKRTKRHRSQFDPPGPTLTPGSLAPASGPPPEVRRHHTDPASRIAFPLLLPVAIAVAIWMALNEDSFWIELLFWGIVLIVPLALMVLVVQFTYTEVGPHGIRLRTPFRSRMFAWSELAEVGWLRDAGGDVVVLSTHDGRRIKTVGVAVTPTGVGHDRALRMLADIQSHWATSSQATTTGVNSSL